MTVDPEAEAVVMVEVRDVLGVFAGAPVPEQRAAVRIPSALGAVCQTEAANGCEARVWNISTTGICLILNRPLEPETSLTIQIELDPGQYSEPLAARVVHTANHLPGLWAVGCELSECLGEEQLGALL